MVSIQFWKNFTGPPFCGGWTKKLQTLSRHFFREPPSKYCIVEFTAVFVCLLLSWSRRHSMKLSSNFDSPQFQQLLTPTPHFFKYDKLLPKIWFIKNSKCPQYFFEEGAAKKTQIFHIFKGPLFHNGWPYWYECWRVLRDFWWLSKKCGFATFPEL